MASATVNVGGTTTLNGTTSYNLTYGESGWGGGYGRFQIRAQIVSVARSGNNIKVGYKFQFVCMAYSGSSAPGCCLNAWITGSWWNGDDAIAHFGSTGKPAGATTAQFNGITKTCLHVTGTQVSGGSGSEAIHTISSQIVYVTLAPGGSKTIYGDIWFLLNTESGISCPTGTQTWLNKSTRPKMLSYINMTIKANSKTGTTSGVKIYVNNAWKDATPYIYNGGWKKATPYTYNGGWKQNVISTTYSDSVTITY